MMRYLFFFFFLTSIPLILLFDAAWIGSISCVKIHGQILISKLYSWIIHVRHPMVLLHQQQSIFLLQNLRHMPLLELTVYGVTYYYPWIHLNIKLVLNSLLDFIIKQPFPPSGAAANANALAGWMANASASSSVQAAVVTASSIPVPQNQGLFSSSICYSYLFFNLSI